MAPTETYGESPLLCLIDPGMGNLRSVARAWEHAGAKVNLVSSPAQVGAADALVFPGQGGMPHCMHALRESGFDMLIRSWIREDRPFFGICLGLQALFEYSEEGNTTALGVFPGEVRRFQVPKNLKIPHMGWNAVRFRASPHPFASHKLDGEQFYFVHSYHVVPGDPDLVWGMTDYGGDFVSAVRCGNCFATQFHPEKSQGKGLQMYGAFVEYLTAGKSPG